mgnify:CR=1 FL=1
MKIEIPLLGNPRIRLDTGTIILPENKISLVFTSNIYKLGTLVGKVISEEETISFKAAADEEIDISEICKKAGTVTIIVSLVAHGEVPIILKEVAHQIHATPELDELKNKISRLELAIQEIKKLVEETI